MQLYIYICSTSMSMLCVSMMYTCLEDPYIYIVSGDLKRKSHAFKSLLEIHESFRSPSDVSGKITSVWFLRVMFFKTIL